MSRFLVIIFAIIARTLSGIRLNFLDKHILSKNQYGFTTGRSTQQAIIELIDIKQF